MIPACGVFCSDCPAFEGARKGFAHQQKVVEAWERMYGLKETPEYITCGGCFSSDKEVFHTCATYTARICCREKEFNTCADCSKESCAKLEQAQKVWDEVPLLKEKLSPADFVMYAEPYCDHWKRLKDLQPSLNS